MFSTLPSFSTLIPSIKSALSHGRNGKLLVWLKALSGNQLGRSWGAYDFFILYLFFLWWPCECCLRMSV